MHAEAYDLPEATVAAIGEARAAGRRIVAVGTTVLRVLETVAAADGLLRPGAGETRLFVTPGFPFRVVDRLLTNFHLPRSTLFMLVAAFAGLERIKAAYAHAIGQPLPLLQLWRCLPDRPRGAHRLSLRFELLAQDGPPAVAVSEPRSARSRPRPSCRSAPPPR